MMTVLVYGGRDFADIPMRNGRPNKQHPLFAQREAELYFVYTMLEKELTIPDDGPNGWHLREPTRIIAGGARGADTAAVEWAILNVIPFKEYPADWKNIERPGAVVRTGRDGKPYDLLAGKVRNQLMIDDGKPSLGIGFPGGSGTADMAGRLVAAGIAVKEFAP